MNNNNQVDATEVINILTIRMAEREKEIAVLAVKNQQLENRIKQLEKGASK